MNENFDATKDDVLTAGAAVNVVDPKPVEVTSDIELSKGQKFLTGYILGMAGIGQACVLVGVGLLGNYLIKKAKKKHAYKKAQENVYELDEEASNELAEALKEKTEEN